MGHCASSARHAHEQRLLCEAEFDKQVLADQAHNPNPQDICWLFNKWRLGSYGDDNGKGLFDKKLLTTITSKQEGRQCCNGMMLGRIKLLVMAVKMRK